MIFVAWHPAVDFIGVFAFSFLMGLICLLMRPRPCPMSAITNRTCSYHCADLHIISPVLLSSVQAIARLGRSWARWVG